MDNEVVAQVQRRLKEFGYTEIGNVDGDCGDLTEKAIIIFRHDVGLPLNRTVLRTARRPPVGLRLGDDLGTSSRVAINEDRIVALVEAALRQVPAPGKTRPAVGCNAAKDVSAAVRCARVSASGEQLPDRLLALRRLVAPRHRSSTPLMSR